MGIASGSELHSYFEQHNRLCSRADQLRRAIRLLSKIPEEGFEYCDAPIAEAILLIKAQVETTETEASQVRLNVAYRAGQFERRRRDRGFIYGSGDFDPTDKLAVYLYGPRGPRPEASSSHLDQT